MVLKTTSGKPPMHTKAHLNPFLVPTVQMPTKPLNSCGNRPALRVRKKVNKQPSHYHHWHCRTYKENATDFKTKADG